MSQFSSLLCSWFQSPRSFFGLLALFSATLLAIGFLLQSVVGLTPCPLCIIQRFLFVGVGITALLAYLYQREFRFFGALAFFLSVLGSVVAARQVFIQLVPPDLGTPCLAGFTSLMEFISVVFQASGNCAERSWTLFFLSVPEWSLLSFLGISSALGFWLFLSPRPDAQR